MSDSDSQILCSVIVTDHQMGRTIHWRDAMNIVDESNLLRGGRGSTPGRTSTATTLGPSLMELGLISQTNACARCGGRDHWLYFCTAQKNWKKGDPIKKLDFDKTKRQGKEKEKGEKGCWRHGQNNTTKAEAPTGDGAASGGGKNGSSGNSDVNQEGNA
ncbi:hypothetical protein BDD12DRAFT_902317 [Trichophaea hybrida]|nr:hypothetical protein BDD12DRAFT_902317 [Trichophaea hybrida]